MGHDPTYALLTMTYLKCHKLHVNQLRRRTSLPQAFPHINEVIPDGKPLADKQRAAASLSQVELGLLRSPLSDEGSKRSEETWIL